MLRLVYYIPNLHYFSILETSCKVLVTHPQYIRFVSLLWGHEPLKQVLVRGNRKLQVEYIYENPQNQVHVEENVMWVVSLQLSPLPDEMWQFLKPFNFSLRNSGRNHTLFFNVGSFLEKTKYKLRIGRVKWQKCYKDERQWYFHLDFNT